MGVPGYFAEARRACPAAVSLGGGKIPTFSTLYVDFNCLVHGAVADARGDDDVIEGAVRRLEALIGASAPTGDVYVCADGVPPEAKIANQRSRRFLARKRPGEDGVFDRNKITPGTAFASAMDAKLGIECARLARSRGTRVVYSGTDEAGEGEQKIMAILRRGRDEGVGCVYGLDADLVLLCACLAAQGLDVPWLCREEEDVLTFVDARMLATAMAGGGSARCLWNHVLCSFFCGNDFLPPMSCLSVRKNYGWLGRLRSICDEERLDLVRDGAICWRDVAVLIGRLSRSEDDDFAAADRDYWSAPRPQCASLSDEWDNYPLLKRGDGMRAIRPGDPDWRARYYSMLFGFRSDAGTGRVVGEYIRGIRWTFEYYKGSFSHQNSPEWCYRYEYGPTSLDVFNALASADGDPPCADLSGLDSPSVSPARLVRFVTPLSSVGVLPDPSEARRPAHLFPEDCEVATYLKRKIWECRAVMPRGTSRDVHVPGENR